MIKESYKVNIHTRAPSAFKFWNILQADRVSFVEVWEYETTPDHLSTPGLHWAVHSAFIALIEFQSKHFFQNIGQIQNGHCQLLPPNMQQSFNSSMKLKNRLLVFLFPTFCWGVFGWHTLFVNVANFCNFTVLFLWGIKRKWNEQRRQHWLILNLY